MSEPTTPRILVISDDPETGAVVRDVVAAGGCDAEYALNSQATPALLASTRPDLVIVDMFAPVLADWPILNHLRRTSPPVPVVALTGRCLSPDALAAVTFYGRAHLQKPFEPAALLRLCERMLAPSTPRPREREANRAPDGRYRYGGDATLLTPNGRPAVVVGMLDVSASGAKIEVGRLFAGQLVPGAVAPMILSMPPRFQPRPVETRVLSRDAGSLRISFPSA
jgi:CheY-like chemotaxis protein